MVTEKEKAFQQFTYLKRRMYDLGAKAQALVNGIHEETESFLSDKDFTAMDFVKTEQLSKELQNIQAEYKTIIEKFTRIKETYGFEV